MNKTLALIPVVFAIFALMLSPAVTSVSAEKGGNGKAQGNPQGCENNKGKDAAQNPNCGVSTGVDSDKDGISDADEIAAGNCLDPNNPDSDNDGWLDGIDAFPCDGTRN